MLLVVSYLLTFSLTSQAQLDFGYCQDRFRQKTDEFVKYCMTGIADKLNPTERDTYLDVKENMNSYQWSYARKNLVDLLLHIRENPKTVCQDQPNPQTGITLVCTHKEGGKTITRKFDWLGTYNLDRHLDKNILTYEEKIARQTQTLVQTNNTTAINEAGDFNSYIQNNIAETTFQSRSPNAVFVDALSYQNTATTNSSTNNSSSGASFVNAYGDE